MAIRMHFPSDVNPEPEATFKRGMAQAFPADPHLTPARRRFPVPNRPDLWLGAALLVLICLTLSGCSGAAAQEPSASITAEDIKRAAAGAWQCPGMHAEWLDETTTMCLKESP